MTVSFVAERDDTEVAIHFSAETYVQAGGAIILSEGAAGGRGIGNPGGGGGPGISTPRMHIRALLDRASASPSSVVFAAGPARSSRSFVFTARVDKGIHTVEMQWKTDNKSTAWMRNASLLVRTARSGLPVNGTLTTEKKSNQGVRRLLREHVDLGRLQRQRLRGRVPEPHRHDDVVSGRRSVTGNCELR